MKNSKIVKRISHNFKSLSDFILFIRIAVLITLISFTLKIFSVKGNLKLYAAKAPEKDSLMPADSEVQKTTKFTDYLLNLDLLCFKYNCLKRCLVLYYMLRKKGLNISIVFGVKSEEGASINFLNSIEGHSWLTYKKAVYIERNEQLTREYKPIYSYPN